MKILIFTILTIISILSVNGQDDPKFDGVWVGGLEAVNSIAQACATPVNELDPGLQTQCCFVEGFPSRLQFTAGDEWRVCAPNDSGFKPIGSAKYQLDQYPNIRFTADLSTGEEITCSGAFARLSSSNGNGFDSLAMSCTLETTVLGPQSLSVCGSGGWRCLEGSCLRTDHTFKPLTIPECSYNELPPDTTPNKPIVVIYWSYIRIIIGQTMNDTDVEAFKQDLAEYLDIELEEVMIDHVTMVHANTTLNTNTTLDTNTTLNTRDEHYWTQLDVGFGSDSQDESDSIVDKIARFFDENNDFFGFNVDSYVKLDEDESNTASSIKMSILMAITIFVYIMIYN